MKTTLTLKSSSFLFSGKIYLVKNIETEIDNDILDNSTRKTINAQIKAGTVLSSQGLFPIEDEVNLESVEDVILAPTEAETVVEVVEEVKTEPAEVVEDLVDEKKKPVARRNNKKAE